MVRVLRYPRLCTLSCLGAFAAAIARDICLGSELIGAANVLLTLTLLFLICALCLISCRFVVDHEGVGVGFLFFMRRTTWESLHMLGTLCCNSRRLYLYGLYKTSPDFLHMLHRAPRCGSWGFVVPMSKKLASALSAFSPYEIDLYSGMRRQREKGMRPVWQHALLQLLTAGAAASAALLTATVLLSRALHQASLFLCALLTFGAALLLYFALQLLYRAFIGLQTCPHISKNGVSAGRGLYLPWEEVRFGYVHRLGRFSTLYLLSRSLEDMAQGGAEPVRCLSMPDTSTLLLSYLTYCPHAQKSRY